MKAIVLKLQKRVRNQWTPVAAKFFDVNNNVNTSTLAEFFAEPCKPSYRILVEERPMRHVPGTPVHIEDLMEKVREYQMQTIRAFHRKSIAKAADAAATAMNDFQRWAEGAGLTLDFSNRAEVTSGGADVLKG